MGNFILKSCVLIFLMWDFLLSQNLNNNFDIPKEDLQRLAKQHFELGDFYLDIYRYGDSNKQISFNNAIKNYQAGLAIEPRNVYYQNRLAYAYHLERRLKEASLHYARVLQLDPPKQVSSEEFELALKLAPRVYVNPKEYFRLEDVAVIFHPDKPFIEYSFFWDDDIDYPEDNDPTDHEKVWVEYDPSTKKFVRLYTYFHRSILTTEESVKDALQNQQRARVNVQWGGHGSLPLGWEKIPRKKIAVKYAHISHPDLIEDMRTRYQIHLRTIRNPSHPLARDWPKRFEGSWEEYIKFEKYVDIRKIIEDKKMVMKSRWSNAVIDQYFLDYQFYPKMEWPDEQP